jgi:hypothetical protein
MIMAPFVAAVAILFLVPKVSSTGQS